jgi:hypothetical protein
MSQIKLKLRSKKWFITGVFLTLFFTETITATPSYYKVDQNSLKLSNKYYEIVFNQSNGGITYILDKTTHQNISLGNRDSVL